MLLSWIIIKFSYQHSHTWFSGFYMGWCVYFMWFSATAPVKIKLVINKKLVAFPHRVLWYPQYSALMISMCLNCNWFAREGATCCESDIFGEKLCNQLRFLPNWKTFGPEKKLHKITCAFFGGWQHVSWKALDAKFGVLFFFRPVGWGESRHAKGVYIFYYCGMDPFLFPVLLQSSFRTMT